MQLLSRAVSCLPVVAERESSPQEEMANPQDMKVCAFGRHRLPEDFVLCVDCNRRHSYLLRIVLSCVIV